MSPLVLLVLSIAHAAPDAAEGPVDPFEEPDENELFRLDEEIVTVASRYAQTLRKAPSIVTLVDAETIRLRGYRTLADLLRDQPGIYVWKSKEGRDLAAFRGIISADNNKILLLVDGVPWYDGVYGHAWIDDYLPISHIKQVEIIKGPGSAIYGTNAFAGVINVVTWAPEDLEGGRIRWLAGTRARSDLTGTVGGRLRVGAIEAGMSGYARWLVSDGDGLDITPRARSDINGSDPKNGIAVGGRFQAYGLDVQIHHVDYRHTFLTNELDDPNDALGKDPDDFSLAYHDTFFDARYTLKLGQDASLRPWFSAWRHDDPGSYWFHTGYTTEETAPGVFDTVEHQTTVETEKDTARWSVGLDAEGRPGIDHVIVGGIGLENTGVVDAADGTPGVVDIEYVDGSHDGVPTGFQGTGRLRNLFAYAQYTWTIIPALEVTAGGRFDMRIPSNPTDNPQASAFKPRVTPRLGVLLVPTERITAKVLYGQAFRQATVRETLVTTDAVDEDGNYEFSRGNLDLAPEQIDTLEAEVDWTIVTPFSLRVDAYGSRVRREIDKVVPPNEYQNLPGNLWILGGEVQGTLELAPVRVDASYALTDARYSADAGPYADRPQYEFPPHMGRGSVQFDILPKLSTIVFGEIYSYRPRFEWGRTVGLDDGSWFGLLHASVRAHGLGKQEQFEVAATVRNLTDTQWGTAMYREDADIGSPGEPRYPNEIEGEGRSVTVSLEGRF